MRKLIEIFKGKKDEALDPAAAAYLRDLAGWPVQQHHRAGSRARRHIITVQRDGAGQVVSSVESTDTDEYEEYSDNWGK